MTFVSAGALDLSPGTALDVKRCSFIRNEAVNGARSTSGGAIGVHLGAFLRVSETTFHGNSVASLGDSFGGAIVVDGSLAIEDRVAFRTNVVFGYVRAVGGAISVKLAASLNSSRSSGPEFVGNQVWHACRVVRCSLRLRWALRLVV
jgi:hypothetical protein